MIRRIIRRLIQAVSTFPTKHDWLESIALLLIYAVVYLPIGFASGFLVWSPQLAFWTVIGVIAGSLLMPGISEELFFRALLIPHPTELIALSQRRLWIIVSWISFVLYHPFNFTAPKFFAGPVFLLGAGLVGAVCTIAYLRSGSLWSAVVIHWAIVAVWLLLLGGLAKFH